MYLFCFYLYLVVTKIGMIFFKGLDFLKNLGVYFKKKKRSCLHALLLGTLNKNVMNNSKEYYTCHPYKTIFGVIYNLKICIKYL